jgi:hypothetical protein
MFVQYLEARSALVRQRTSSWAREEQSVELLANACDSDDDRAANSH